MEPQRPEHEAMATRPSSKEEATWPDGAASANLAWTSKRRRLATVYDAVAGRVSYNQTLRDTDDDAPELVQGNKFTTNTTNRPTPYPPDEVLFRRRKAPERYAEHDVYFANERDFPDAGQDVLPDSDLLTAVHGYASRFYEAVEKREVGVDHSLGRNLDERSMDETALLAFGILLEEAGREVLGRRGDLVFTEEANSSGHSDEDEVITQTSQSNENHARSASTSNAKRRKLTDP